MTEAKTTKSYLSCAETARLLRQALKNAFPGVKFGVRSKTYSGGASIRVNFEGGPCAIQVERVTNQFQGASFDGMVDLKSYSKHYLLPDGSVKLASYHPDGVSGQVGIVQALPEGSRLVSLGADFIFVDRNSSCGHEHRDDCERAIKAVA